METLSTTLGYAIIGLRILIAIPIFGLLLNQLGTPSKTESVGRMRRAMIGFLSGLLILLANLIVLRFEAIKGGDPTDLSSTLWSFAATVILAGAVAYGCRQFKKIEELNGRAL